MSDKTGRNEPCPCGSGKKFKKCCYSDISAAEKDFFGPLPDSLHTDTKLDFYLEVFHGAAFYAEDLKRSPNSEALCEDYAVILKRSLNPGQRAD